MKIKTFAGLGVCALALGAVVGVIGTQQAKGVNAATETTVYYVISDTDKGTYDLKLNVNRKGDGDDWMQYAMSKVDGKTYESNPIYTCTFTDLWDGLGVMQFQLYDGETWKSQDEAISTWTSAENYNGKMWVHGGSSWKAYTWDGDPEPPASSSEEVATDYFVVGDFNTWNAGETAKMALSDEKKDGKDQYYLSLTGLVKDQEFKVKSSKNDWFPASNMKIPANGDYTIFFVPEGGVTEWTDGGGYIYLKLDKEGGEVELDYFAVGDFNSWKAQDANYKLSKMTEQKDNKDQYEITIEGLAKDSKIKMMSSAGGYFPSGTGNDYVIPAAGDYTFYFVPEGGITDEGWWNGFFYAALKEDPGTSSSQSSASSTGSTGSSKSEASTGTGLYLRGTAVGGWDVAEANELEEHGTDLGCILNVELSVGDFKIAKADWSQEWGWLYKNTDEENDHVTVIGGAKDNFEAGESDNNIHCAVAGFYDIYLTSNNYISVELHDQPAPIKDFFFVSTGDFGDGTKAYLATYDTDGEKDLPGVEINGTNFVGATCTQASNFNEMGGVWTIPTGFLKSKFVVTIVDSENQVKAQTQEISKADGLFIAPGATAEQAAGSNVLAWQARLVALTEAAILEDSNAKSVCNVAQGAAQKLVDAYDGLKIKAAFDKSTLWTYDPSQTYDEAIEAETKVMADVSYADIIEQLRVIAYPAATAWNVKTVANNMTLIITISIVAAGVAVAGTMYLISKKRRLQK